MIINTNNIDINFDKIPVSEFWNEHSEKESKMHKIHAYPAKFPAFIVTKSLGYAKQKGLEVDSIADIFCGCGTTALEAKQNEIDFWGCDINPVATLIARVKSSSYETHKLESHHRSILAKFEKSHEQVPEKVLGHERIRYWFHESQIVNLFRLLSIIQELPKGRYRDFFLCAFSNILKPTSKWLTKSIKPQIDPNKAIRGVKEAYCDQFNFMLKGVKELEGVKKSSTQITTQNLLNKKIRKPFADLLVTSPPYVTSYEYADLHQLSTLWLGYVDDYRDLRKGTIGSVYHTELTKKDQNSINFIGRTITQELEQVDKAKSKSALKYFVDIDKAVLKSYSIINPGGMAVFVIGNTKYGHVKVDNVKYITLCMLDAGFTNLDVVQRKVSSKILTPYRDKKGRFSAKSTNQQVYSHEYVIVGTKK